MAKIIINTEETIKNNIKSFAAKKGKNIKGFMLEAATEKIIREGGKDVNVK